MCLREEGLPLLPGQELEELPDRAQQYFRIPVVQVRSRQKVRTDHLQTIAATVPNIRAAVSIACSMTGIWLL